MHKVLIMSLDDIVFVLVVVAVMVLLAATTSIPVNVSRDREDIKWERERGVAEYKKKGKESCFFQSQSVTKTRFC